jgi:hypothetical protein
MGPKVQAQIEYWVRAYGVRKFGELAQTIRCSTSAEPFGVHLMTPDARIHGS